MFIMNQKITILYIVSSLHSIAKLESFVKNSTALSLQFLPLLAFCYLLHVFHWEGIFPKQAVYEIGLNESQIN